MIFENTELYNVAELEPLGRNNAYKMLRVPKAVSEKMNRDSWRINTFNSGVELRFVMKSDYVKIKLCTNEIGTVSRCVIYYGGLQAGWDNITRYITSDVTEITIKAPQNLDMLDKITRDNGLAFNPRCVRVLMLNTPSSIIGVSEGEIEPPTADMVPKKRLLCYGSSITHGSLAISQNNTYAFRTATDLGCDLINLGYAGTAQMDSAMADYIAEQKADIITLEMGINVVDWMAEEEFRSRVEYFIKRVAESHSDKPVFCIDLFYCEHDLRNSGKADRFREIVRETVEKLSLPNTVYVNGKTVLDGSWGLSADLGHPNARACEIMSRNLVSIIRRRIG